MHSDQVGQSTNLINSPKSLASCCLHAMNTGDMSHSVEALLRQEQADLDAEMPATDSGAAGNSWEQPPVPPKLPLLDPGCEDTRVRWLEQYPDHARCSSSRHWTEVKHCNRDCDFQKCWREKYEPTEEYLQMDSRRKLQAKQRRPWQ